MGILADRPLNSKFNATDYTGNIAVAAFYREGDKDVILNLKKSYNDQGTFILYSPDVEKAFDLSLLIILFMAVFTISVGSVWSGYTKRAL